MFTLDNYKVSFQHVQFKNNPMYKGGTTCRIFDTNDEEEYARGITLCSRLDQFNKAVGRKVSLARAIEEFDKETRTRFWNKYWETLGGVK